FGVTVRERGNRIGDISGMAPLARIAVYKACWGFTDDPDGGCWSNDSVAAIDQAVADGVDAINFSISGTSDNYLDAVEIAFLFANAAGIFVGAASGNEGPGAGTTNHPSPWLTTVAAGTHDRLLRATLTLGNGVTFEGASLNDDQTRNLPIVYAGDIPADGADPAEAALCFPETLDPQEARGKMVICDRGVNARVEKSQTVDEAGGRAMILVNVTPGTLNADIHYVPSIHLNEVDGLAVKLYASTNFRPRGRIGESRVETDPTAPVIAGFSSRGPSEAGGDILKPDIMAPGVDVLAAVSPIAGQGLNYDFFQGTSMATPHIVGIGAVLTSAHPDWSAAALRSAMMTTAMDTAAGAFDEGSGQAAPNAALNPGLVYDNTFPEYLGFLCGTGQLMSPACASLAIDPSDLNQPNISIGDLAGSQTVTRTVTNVGGAGTYNVAVNAPAGIDVVVSPTSLTLGAGESASYQVTLTRTTAALDTYAMGSLSWSDGTHNVRSVIAVRPVQLAAPDEVFGMGTTGSIDYTVDFGYSGPFSATPHGLLAATQTAGFVVDDPANNINTALATGVGITVHAIPVPAGTAVARFSLFDDFTDGNDDLDLYVFDSAGNFIGGSGTATSEEQVDVVFPAPGSYFVVVHGFATDESSGGPGSNYTLFNWNVSSAPNGGLPTDLMITAPTEAVLGTSATITVSWAGLTGGEKYLGAVLYNDGVGVIDLTIVTVNA
ncbi:MAG TPA: S8 family serine peptidase, partial [Acidimicrobiia bacterium]